MKIKYSELPGDIQELHMEYGLTMAMHMPCCAKYLFDRKPVLIPEIVAIADREQIEPAMVFLRFVNRLHEKRTTKQVPWTSIRKER